MIRTLRQLEALSHFGDAEIETLAGLVTRTEEPEGALLVREREVPSRLLILLRGQARVRRGLPEGSVDLDTLERGALVGEGPLLDDQTPRNEVVALSDLQLAAAERSRLEEAADGDLRFGLALYWSLWRSLAAKLRRADERFSTFFGHEMDAEATRRDEATGRGGGAARVGLSAKRALFQEQKLSDLEINLLSALSQERRYGPGEVVFSEGEEGDCMYLVAEGKVMISKHIPGAGEEALDFLDRGAYFGEMALIDRQPRSATARGHGDGAVLLAMPRGVVQGLLDIRKVSSLRLLRLLGGLLVNRLAGAEEKLVGWSALVSGPGDSPPTQR